jgi:hypothetical protein
VVVAETVLLVQAWAAQSKADQEWDQSVDRAWVAKTRAPAADKEAAWATKAVIWVTRVETWAIRVAVLLLLLWTQMRAAWIVETLAVVAV